MADERLTSEHDVYSIADALSELLSKQGGVVDDESLDKSLKTARLLIECVQGFEVPEATDIS